MAPMMVKFNRRWTGAILAVGLLAIGVLFSTSGSDFEQEEVPLQEDAQLLARAQQVIRNGNSVLLRDITGGDWDRVDVFPGPSLRESVESTVNAPIDMPDIYNNESGGIVVFTKGDTVQRAVDLLPYPFDGHGGTYGPNVTVARPNPNASWLKFTDTPR